MSSERYSTSSQDHDDASSRPVDAMDTIEKFSMVCSASYIIGKDPYLALYAFDHRKYDLDYDTS